MDTKVSWDLYQSLNAVLQEGTLSGAAKALHSSQPTVGRHITALEEVLQTTLFIRTKQGLVPTETCLQLAPHTRGIAHLAHIVERLAASRDTDQQAVIRLTCSDVIAAEVLPKVLTELQLQHPKIKVELSLSDDSLDLLNREADIAIRLYRPKQMHLLTQHAVDIPLGLFASEQYVRRQGLPNNIAELAQHQIVGFDKTTDFVLEALAETSLPLARDEFAISVDSNLAQLAYIKAGAGIGICQCQLAKNIGLMHIMPKQVKFELEAWVTMHEDLRHIGAYMTSFRAIAQGLKDFYLP